MQAVAEPILSPVNEPGPPDTAIASNSETSVSVILQISSIIGSKVCECVTLLLIVYSAVIISSVSIAVEHTRDDASIASIFILKIL